MFQGKKKENLLKFVEKVFLDRKLSRELFSKNFEFLFVIKNLVEFQSITKMEATI